MKAWRRAVRLGPPTLAVLSATAVAFTSPRLHAQAAAPGIQVSANPVRSAPVHLHWPAGAGDVRVAIYSQLGTRIVNTVLPSDPGTFAWDLTTERGEPVANGAYAVVVSRADGRRFRRRLLVAR